MLATFYLTGPFSASTLSDTFTITGEPGGIVHPGVTKAQLLTGHTIVFVDSVTGGTVTATNETCEGTQKNWLVIQSTPTPTPTSTPTSPTAQFSTSNGSNTSSSGTGTSNYSPTITVTNGTVTIRLTASVQTGYQADSTITIPGVGSYSPTAAQGAGNSSFVEFNLDPGVYNCTWTVSAISQGEFTVATATLTQVG